MFVNSVTSAFIEEKLGSKYTERKSMEFSKSFEESNSTTPIFFILSPGVDPLKVIKCQPGFLLRNSSHRKSESLV